MATKSTTAGDSATGAKASGASSDAKASEAAAPKNYEAARDELAAVVEKLESGGLSLDESLTLWERGQSLAAACETFLAGARARVDAALAAESESEGQGPTVTEP